MSRPSQIGPYRIVEKLGRGRHATVYKAARPDLDRPVALKVLRDYDQSTLEKFEHEARLSRRLKIPGVRRTYEAGRTPEGYIFLAMEYVDVSLKEVIRRHGRPFTRDEVVRLLEPIAQALDAIHQQGLVHLDVKPENILVSEDGRAVLADFGITRRKTETTTEGTPRYMSPEQATGDRPVSPQSDVYSLGVVIYEMLTGRPPFESGRDDVLMRQHVQDDPPAPRTLNPHVDWAVARTLLSALNKTPHERPISAGALLRELAVAHSTPITMAVDTVRERPQVALIPVGVLAAALIGFFIWGPFSPSPSTSTPTPSISAPTSAPTSAPADGPSGTPATANGTLTPDAETPSPTFTPAGPTSTPRRETATFTPSPVTPAAATTPRLSSPDGGATLRDETVTFRWTGKLGAGQTFVVNAYHDESRQAVTCETNDASCAVRLPAERHGGWRWSVSVEPGGPQSEERTFWFAPFSE